MQKPLGHYTEAKLSRERWAARERGRKPSGDLRHPVPRNRRDQIIEELRLEYEAKIVASERAVRAIEAGDVAGIECIGPQFDGGDAFLGDGAPMLVLQSDLDQREIERRARASRTQDEIEAHEATWDALYEEALANPSPIEPEPEIPNLPDLPTDREPRASEVAALSLAIERHLNYLKREEQIAAKREADGATKLRTAAKREAEEADPEGTAATKKAIKLKKAAERQRRWRERMKARNAKGA